MKLRIAFVLICGAAFIACTLEAQDVQNRKAAAVADGPPNLLLVVHQELQGSKMAERQKLEISMSRAADRLDAPNFWIEMESMTGPRDVVFFEPFDSFEHLEQAMFDWTKFCNAHPEVAHIQQELDGVVPGERTASAIRREDLSYAPQPVDFSKARYVRIQEVRLFPGHGEDFTQAIKLLIDIRTAIKLESPFVVYEVNAGLPAPTFFIVSPMVTLAEDDNPLTWRANLEESEAAPWLENLSQIARDSYSSSESNLYAIHPEMSHVPKEFVAGDPNYWRPSNKPETKPRSEVAPSGTPTKKGAYEKP